MSTSLTIDNLWKFHGAHAGRDKEFRLIQYIAKFVAYRLTVAGAEKDQIQRFAKLSSVLSQARKLFRIGKFAENFQKAYLDMLKKPVQLWDLPYILGLGRNITVGFYLLNDSIQWLTEIGFLRGQDLKAIKDARNKWWFASIVFSFALASYKLSKANKLQARERDIVLKSEGEKAVVARTNIAKIEQEKFDLMVELLKNAADFTIPLTALKYLSFNDGITGILGTISSACGVYAAWPAAK